MERNEVRVLSYEILIHLGTSIYLAVFLRKVFWKKMIDIFFLKEVFSEQNLLFTQFLVRDIPDFRISLTVFLETAPQFPIFPKS